MKKNIDNKTNENQAYVEVSVKVSKIDDCLKCDRCWKYLNDVGKIKEYPDVCLRCADAIDYMVKNNLSPNGGYKDWSEWMAVHENYHKGNPIRAMETTHTVNGFNVVYMDEHTFKSIYKERL